MTKAHPLFLEVASQLRELACGGETDWCLSDHAIEEMLNDHLELPDIVYAIQHGKIVRGKLDGDCWNYVVEGKTTDGFRIAMPVSFSTEEKYIDIITVWRIH